MISRDLQWAQRAADLRREFDRSFAEPPRADPELVEDLLAIRVGDEPFAIRLAQVSGLFVDRKITPVIGPAPEFVGLAGFRGAIVPVFDLGALVGQRPTTGARWLVVAADAPVALAFHGFDGHLRLPRSAIARSDRAEHAGRHVHEVLCVAGAVRPIVHIASVLDEVTQLAQQAAPRKGG